MAKVSLAKITPIKKLDKVIIKINDEDVEVIQYLPVAEKADLSERVVNAAIDPENGILSTSRRDVYSVLEIVRTYTNINITDKMMEEAPKTYDLLVLNDVFHQIVEAIPKKEYGELFHRINDDCENVQKYLESFKGIMKSINQDYSNTEMDVDKIMNELKDPEAYGLLRDILDKIG